MSQPFFVVKNGSKSAETSVDSFKMAELPTSSLKTLRMRFLLPLTHRKAPRDFFTAWSRHFVWWAEKWVKKSVILTPFSLLRYNLIYTDGFLKGVSKHLRNRVLIFEFWDSLFYLKVVRRSTQKSWALVIRCPSRWGKSPLPWEISIKRTTSQLWQRFMR